MKTHYEIIGSLVFTHGWRENGGFYPWLAESFYPWLAEKRGFYPWLAESFYPWLAEKRGFYPWLAEIQKIC